MTIQFELWLRTPDGLLLFFVVSPKTVTANLIRRHYLGSHSTPLKEIVQFPYCVGRHHSSEEAILTWIAVVVCERRVHNGFHPVCGNLVFALACKRSRKEYLRSYSSDGCG